MSLITFGVGFTVTPTLPGTPISGKSVPDFPPTPAAPEPWLLGCVQNVVRDTIEITWVQDDGSEMTETSSGGQALDADSDAAAPVKHLPFARISNGVGLPPSVIGLLYGLPGRPAIPAVLPAGPGPAWDIATGGTGPFGLISTDAPSVTVFAFKGGGAISGSPNPIIEVSRSITLQIWLSVVRIGDRSNASKHNILGFSNAFTLSGSYDRRANPSSATFVHFEPSKFNQTAISFTANTGNQSPPPLAPIVSGQLSVVPVRQWLKSKGFG
jgi:hypothetical protein